MTEERHSEDEECNNDCPDDIPEMKYGDRLLDDLINTFCDKLTSVCPYKIEGMLAIQFLMIDPEQVCHLISGDNRVIQILYDSIRQHYILIYYNNEKIFLYDSVYAKDRNLSDVMNECVLRQITCLFGHLFENHIVPLYVVRDLNAQHDDWSCGYRSVASLVELVCGRDPSMTIYSRRRIFKFLHEVLCSSENLSWKSFLNAQLGIERQRNYESAIHVHVFPNGTYHQHLNLDEKSELSAKDSSEN